LVGRNLSLRRQRGLTLVELLVVIVILALASSVVLLNAPPARPEARDDAERFAAKLMLAFDQAIARGAAIRLTIDSSGYGFEMMSEGEWRAMDEPRALARKAFDRRTTAIVEIEDAAAENARRLNGGEDADGDEDEAARRIPLDPLGAQTAFSVRFSSPAGAWLVRVSENAEIEVAQNG
jgi:type II secretion system protein H